MSRSRILPFALVLLIGAGCAGDLSEGESEPQEAVENRFVGGWDGSQTRGPTVLLLREGLSGTLAAASLGADGEEYRLAYDIAGELDEMTEDVTLNLACSEVSSRPLAVAPPPQEPEDTEDPSQPPVEGEPEEWGSLDCAGWELALECGLAGDCTGGDCNMICDVIHFGDAYATAELALTDVEDELDFWERV